MFGRFLKRVKQNEAGAASAEDVLAAAAPVEGKLFQVTGPEDASCVCNDWVGAVLSVDGADTDYASLSNAVADGLFHAGCRHSLRAYGEDGAAGEDAAQALFRTQLAVDLMQRRVGAGEPGGEERFTRLYGWARRAEQAGGQAVAVALCEAALAELQDPTLFGPNHGELERILKARIATIRARVQNK